MLLSVQDAKLLRGQMFMRWGEKMSNEETTRLTATLSRETDLALRAFLGARGMRKGDLSKVIEDAVRWWTCDQAVQGGQRTDYHGFACKGPGDD